jgi:F-type H+-transporting ATPase subunit b
MRSRHWRVFFSVLLFLLMAVVQAHAAEEGGSGATERATELFKWINFLIVAGLIGWVFLKLTPPFFQKNAETISWAITKAGAAKAEAERQFREAESKLAHLDKEIAELRAAAQREIAVEGERIRNVTRSDAERVSVAAKAEIEAAERAAKIELRILAADLAVKGAESLLVRQLTPEAQESLVASFVSGLQGSPN